MLFFVPEQQGYTKEILSHVCPVCHAVGKCLKPKRDGQDYMPYPHPERVALAKENPHA